MPRRIRSGMEIIMEKNHNSIAQEFNVISLLRFVAPTVVMLVFMSLYQMVDAVFVSKFVGENALSALNIVYPFPSVVIAVSIMLATGGSAVIARNMGEEKRREAKENFSFIVLVGAVVGAVIVTAGVLFIEPVIYMLGATPSLYDYCYDYLFILILSAPLSVFQMLFQSFFVTAGKPHLGLTLTVLGGAANIILDYVFIVLCGFGVSGAALATSIGYSIPGFFGLVYFAVSRKGTLYFVKPVFRWRMLLKCCANGSSEMVNNLAVAVTTFLFNVLMLKYAGEAGVAAITIVLYAQFLMTSAFMGFSSGIAPVVSFNYGSRNVRQLKKNIQDQHLGHSGRFRSGLCDSGNLLGCGDNGIYPGRERGVRADKIWLCDIFLQFSVYGHKYFCIGAFYGVFKWKGVRDTVIFEDVCIFNGVPACSSAVFGSGRDMARGADRGDAGAFRIGVLSGQI